jgi:hypothetical protein
MLADFSEAVVTESQNDRLEEGAAPKTINEEVGFLLRILNQGSPPMIFLYSSSVKARQVSVVKLP